MKKNTFTIEEIHQIRYENEELNKGLSHAEIIAGTQKKASKVWEQIEALKKKRKASDGLLTHHTI